MMDSTTFWNKIARKYAQDPIRDPDGYARTLGIIKDRLQPHHRVLEIGCGTGSTALELAGIVDRYIGTDVSQEMIAIARDRQTPETPDNLSFAVHPAEDIPAAPHDAILALNLLHLLPNPEAVLSAVHAALPADGLFIAKTVLLQEGPWFLSAALPVMRLLGKAPYVRKLGEDQLFQMLENAGFDTLTTVKQPGLAPRIFTVARKI